MAVLDWAWARLCWTGLGCAALGFAGLGLVGLAPVGLDWAWLACFVLDVVGQHWGWARLGWAGLGRVVHATCRSKSAIPRSSLQATPCSLAL